MRRKNDNEARFAKGSHKLAFELDVVNIMRSMRDLKLMSEALLGPKERMLLKFQHKNVIKFETSSTDSDNYTYDTVKLMKSTNNFVKLGQIVKINNILKQYKGKKLEKTD